MSNRPLKCGILGGGENELQALSELHQREGLDVAFVYDPSVTAVALEIAEILGIPALHDLEALNRTGALDYVLVTEPRGRFQRELQVIAQSGAEIVAPSQLLKKFRPVAKPVPVNGDAARPYTVDDAFTALERLFDRGELLEFLLDAAVKATNSSAGSIMLYAPDTKELYIGYATGLSERTVKSTRQKLGDGIAGQVALNREAQLISLPPDKNFYERERERVDIASAISVPLVREHELLGVLNVSSARGEHSHDQSDLQTLRRLSNKLARVMWRSLELQRAGIKHRESRFRTSVGEIAMQEAGAQEKFSVVTRYLSETVRAETVELYLSTTEGDWLMLGGSNRVTPPHSQRLRLNRAALSRAYLEKRCVVLAEHADGSEDPEAPLAAIVYCHVPIAGGGGVIAFEFAAHDALEEFNVIRDAVLAELAKFVSWELRERRLKRELSAYAKVSQLAATLLGCRQASDVAEVLARIAGEVFECETVSVELGDVDAGVSYVLSKPDDDIESWKEHNDERHRTLREKREVFSLAYLKFDSEVRNGATRHRSVLGAPIMLDNELVGGFVAYNKNALDPMEEVIFTDLDRVIAQHLSAMAASVIQSLQPAGEDTRAQTYEQMLQDNRGRFETACESEILRSDRYHHPFAVVMFRMPSLERLFDEDSSQALSVVKEVTQGIRTRTRRTDHGYWMDRSSYALISLDSDNRVRFLISRIIQYLAKDIRSSGADDGDVLVGTAAYPGTARNAKGLLKQAEANLSTSDPR